MEGKARELKSLVSDLIDLYISDELDIAKMAESDLLKISKLLKTIDTINDLMIMEAENFDMIKNRLDKIDEKIDKIALID